MKKILSVVLMAAMVLSVAGCGASTETPEAPAESVKTTSSAVEENNVDEITTTTEADNEELTEETTSVTVETEEIIPIPTSASMIGNGYMKLYADGKDYIYNIEENQMMEYSLANGKITEVSGSIAIYQYVHDYYVTHGVLNLETGEIIASLDTNGAEVMVGECIGTDKYEFINDGYVFIWKTEEKFSGNVFSFGVINDKGEWVAPMSDEYDICKKVGGHISRVIAYDGYLGEGMFISNYASADRGGVVYHIYDFKTDKTYNLTDLLERYGWNNTEGAFVKDGYFYLPAEKAGSFMKYNLETGEIEEDGILPKNAYYKFIANNGVLKYAYYDIRSTEYYDYDFNLIAKYDYEDYDFVSVGYNSVKNLLFTCKKNNQSYFCIMNSDGEFCFEPFVSPISESLSNNKSFITDTSCIVINQFEAMICDLVTGEYTYYDYYACKDGVHPIDADVKTNTIIFRTEEGCFLVNATTPDIFINPFEKVKTVESTPSVDSITEEIMNIAEQEAEMKCDWIYGYELTEEDIMLIKNQMKEIIIWYMNSEDSDNFFKEGELTEEKALGIMFFPNSNTLPLYSGESFLIGQYTNDDPLDMIEWGVEWFDAQYIDEVLLKMFGIEASHNICTPYFYYYDGRYYTRSTAAGGFSKFKYDSHMSTDDGRIIMSFTFMRDKGYNEAIGDWEYDNFSRYALISVHESNGRKYIRYHAISNDIKDVTP